MAILSSPFPSDRRGTKADAAASRRRRSLVVEWLDHPMASYASVLVPVVLLLILGAMMVLSASSVYAEVRWDDAYYFVKRHVVFLLVGVVLAGFISVAPLKRIRAMSWILVSVTFLLQVLTLTSAGFAKKGNRNWLEIGFGQGIQPSEFAKLAIVVWGADVLTRKAKLLDQPKHLLIPFVPVCAVLIGLVVLGGDLGTALIMGLIVMAVLWFVGAPWRMLGSILAVIGVAVAGLVITAPNRLNRIFGFLNQDLDPLGVNHQPIRAMFALASGGWWGVGLGASRQKWGGLVEAHTDYILAVIGEELGLVGTLAVLGLFALIGFAGFRIAFRCDDGFARLAAAGVTSWITIQALVNIAVVLRMIPVLGVPLPLLSYGGSALLANLMALGVLLACARNEPQARAYLEQRRKSRKTAVSAVIPARQR